MNKSAIAYYSHWYRNWSLISSSLREAKFGKEKRDFNLPCLTKQNRSSTESLYYSRLPLPRRHICISDRRHFSGRREIYPRMHTQRSSLLVQYSDNIRLQLQFRPMTTLTTVCIGVISCFFSECDDEEVCAGRPQPTRWTDDIMVAPV